MKKITLALIILSALLNLTGCEKSAEEKAADQQVQAQKADANLWHLEKEMPANPRPTNVKHY